MKLHNRDNIHIPPEKLTAYLLSETHAVGRSKARFFQSIGFDTRNVNVLRQQLLDIALDNEVSEVIPSIYGTKYIIEGILQTSIAGPVRVRTVWIIETEQNHPRLITVYPL
jgi:hypothetical protein